MGYIFNLEMTAGELMIEKFKNSANRESLGIKPFFSSKSEYFLLLKALYLKSFSPPEAISSKSVLNSIPLTSLKE